MNSSCMTQKEWCAFPFLTSMLNAYNINTYDTFCDVHIFPIFKTRTMLTFVWFLFLKRASPSRGAERFSKSRSPKKYATPAQSWRCCSWCLVWTTAKLFMFPFLVACRHNYDAPFAFLVHQIVWNFLRCYMCFVAALHGWIIYIYYFSVLQGYCK